MADDIAPEVAPTSPGPEESSTPAPDQTVAATEPDSPPETAEPKRNRAEERIRGLNSDVHALREVGEYWRNRALEGLTPSVETTQPAAKPPTLEDCDHDTEVFVKRTADWAVKQAEGAAKQQVDESLRLQAVKSEKAAIQDQWLDRSAKFAETHKDFTEITTNPTVQISKDMADIFMESDLGPAIAYHLGQNPDEAARISRMTPRKMTLAFGRLEQNLSSPKPQPTNAPNPPKPVGGQQPTIDPSGLSIDDWVVKRREELRQQGRR